MNYITILLRVSYIHTYIQYMYNVMNGQKLKCIKCLQNFTFMTTICVHVYLEEYM